jgi:deoxyribonuclease IV
MSRYIGAHTIDKGGLHMSAVRAGKAGMTALQVFTAIPKYYGDKSSIRPERVTRFRAALAEAGIEPAQVLVHAAYVLNTATGEEEKWQRAAAGLRKELERSSTLGAGAICFHPGAATGCDRLTAVQRVAQAITYALEGVTSNTRILVENTAGAGVTIGKTADEVGAILAAVPAALRGRTGYGLDTCHLYASGHDITQSAAALTQTLDEFEQAAGAPPSFFHLNDSEGGLGSNKDRHVLIGDGRIGKEPFAWLLHDRRSLDVPLILETPQQNYEVADDDPTPDPYDLKMMEMLRSLV